MKPLARLQCWDAVTSLGESAAETAVLLRAGICNVDRSHFIDRTGASVMLCAAPMLPAELPPDDRIAALAGHALKGMLHRLQGGVHRATRRAAPIVLLALPERFAAEDGRGGLNAQGRETLDRLRHQLPPACANTRIETFPFGRAAGALALRRATQLLDGCTPVIWGGVDTLHDWAVLQALEASDRLLTTENIDGVRPGEAAAFVLLDANDGVGDVALLALGMGREPHPVGAPQPSLAIGMAVALDSAVAPLRAAAQRTNNWLFDLSHESYGTQALQNTIARFGDVLGAQSDLQLPLKELGDVGAAAMPLLVVLAAEAWRLGFAADTTAVVSAGSDDGARGALLLAGRLTVTPPGLAA